MSSMQKSTTDVLQARAEALTTCNTVEGAVRRTPPAVAAQSPLHELLIEEVAAVLPPAVAQRLREAPAVEPVNDWIAAGAMYSWIRDDPGLAKRLLDEIGNRPKDAALSLARTIAGTLDPPPPDPNAPLLDRFGLLIETALAAALLMLRGLFLAFLWNLISGPSVSIDLATIARQAFVPDVLESTTVHVGIQVLITASATSWFLLECLFVPHMLEYARALPLRNLSRRAHAYWRPDALHFLWACHAVAAQCLLSAECIQSVYVERDALRNPAVRTWMLLWLLVSLCNISAVLRCSVIARCLRDRRR